MPVEKVRESAGSITRRRTRRSVSGDGVHILAIKREVVLGHEADEGSRIRVGQVGQRMA